MTTPLKRRNHLALWAYVLLLAIAAFAPLQELALAEVPSPNTWTLAAGIKTEAFNIDGKLAHDNHIYLRVKLPSSHPLALLPTHFQRVVVHGSTYGVAVLGVFDTGPELLVRLAGATFPDALELTLLSTSKSEHEERTPGSVHRLTLKGAKTAPGVKDLHTRFYRGLSQLFAQDTWNSLAGIHPFWAFASARLKAIADGTATATVPEGPRRANRDAMMSLFTGMTSIDETLQADRALRIRAQSASTYTVALKDITPVPLPTHPWDTMLKELPGEPVVEPLAAAVPETMIYAHFHDLRSLLKLGGDMEHRAGFLSVLGTDSGGDTHVIQRYEQQLVLERLGLAEKVGHIATDGVVLALGDPFVRDGTDVSILFKVKNRVLLVSALDLYEANARAKRPDLTASTYKIDDVEVRRLSTPDRTHDQHRIELGDLLIISNSSKALERFIAVNKGKAKALSAAGDFRYMRNLYPFNTADEDGFIFVSDAAVTHAVSPQVRILQARRMEARADLQAVAFSALLAGWLEGKPVEKADDMIKLGLLVPGELQHADATPIAFSRTAGPSSERWGRPAALTPLSELTITHASPAERDAYDAFVSSYQRNWSTFVDPIAVRVRRLDDGKTLDVDMRILPLIANSEYNDIIEIVGDTFMQLPKPTPDGGFEFWLTLDPDSKMMRELDGLSREGKFSMKPSAFVGTWFTMGLAEMTDTWKALRAMRDFPLTGPRETVSGEKEMIDLLRKTSFYFAVHLKNPALCTKFLWELDKNARETDFTGPITLHKYRDIEVAHVPLVARMIGDLGDSLGYFVVVKDVLIYAFNEETIHKQMDRVLDGELPKPAKEGDSGATQSAARAAWPNAKGDLPHIALDVLEYKALEGCTRANIAFEILARGLTFLPSDPEILKTLSLAYLGAEPSCPHGGAFSFDPYGVVQHTLYGSLIAPTPYAVPRAGSPLTEAVQDLRELTGQVSFEGKDNHRNLHVHLRWSQEK